MLSIGHQPKLITSGEILLHSKQQVMAFGSTWEFPLAFKIEATAAVPARFLDCKAQNYGAMWVVFTSNDVSLIQILEAALISEFHTPLVAGIIPIRGGEGALNHKKHHMFFTSLRAGLINHNGLVEGRAKKLKSVVSTF